MIHSTVLLETFSRLKICSFRYFLKMSSDDDNVPDLQPLNANSAPRETNSSLQGHVEADGPLRLEINRYVDPVPVLLLTGYLGSGKTTLVNHILTEKHGYRCAVLLNEIGDTADIEKALVKEPEVCAILCCFSEMCSLIYISLNRIKRQLQ